MAYVLVMGGLALSVSFTLGWALWRLGRVALRWLSGGTLSGRSKVTPKPRQRGASRSAAPKAPAKAKPASSRSARTAKAAKPPKEPWGLTRWLAGRHSLLPLASLSLMLYALGRIVAFGLDHRPVEAPSGFAGLVDGLGWGAAILLGLAVLSLLARWRCRG
ncbi:hypothetical protein [Halomonas sp.]|uniref:hypothetical protein n=1 Tax=Halomonas sp. TaxID=1486246 RepID=UPI003D1448CF